MYIMPSILFSLLSVYTLSNEYRHIIPTYYIISTYAYEPLFTQADILNQGVQLLKTHDRLEAQGIIGLGFCRTLGMWCKSKRRVILRSLGQWPAFLDGRLKLSVVIGNLNLCRVISITLRLKITYMAPILVLGKSS